MPGSVGAETGEITYLEAIRQALFEEMARDENVFCLGEDIGAYGGAFKVTDGLMARFGARRVVDTPISVAAIVGAAAGAAHMGLRPVCEMQFIDFISCAYDMLTNYVATARYRAFLPCPMVVRGPSGGYVRGGPFHSQNPEAAFLHTPGLKIVYPATASDAKGLLKSAIRDEDCVLFFEHKYLYRRIKERMPEGEHLVPIGKARTAREGRDLSIITYAATVWKALEAAERLEREDGLSVDVRVVCQNSVGRSYDERRIFIDHKAFGIADRSVVDAADCDRDRRSGRINRAVIGHIIERDDLALAGVEPLVGGDRRVAVAAVRIERDRPVRCGRSVDQHRA